MTHDIVVGTTEPQDFRLLESAGTLVGTGFTIGLSFRGTVTGVTIAWLNQAAGTVRVSGLGTLDVGEYPFRFTLTDSGSKVGFVPNGASPDVLRVVRA